MPLSTTRARDLTVFWSFPEDGACARSKPAAGGNAQ